MLPASITDLELDAIIPLFIIDNFNLLSPRESIRFSNYTGVSFEGEEYQALGCESEGWDYVGQGPINNPMLRVSNIGRIISDWLYQAKISPSNYRIEGCTVTRRLTQKKFLDGQPNATDSVKFLSLPDIFALEQVTAETYAAVEFRLSNPFEVDDRTIPGRYALRQCSWQYRFPECGYTGAQMYDINDQPTLDPTKDQCSKTLNGCKARFGAYSVLPFGGSPGLNSFG